MTKIEEAIALAKKMANDSSHGYDQASRWGPNYDCSSFLISVWESVGVLVKTNGATYTGNMRSVFLRCGFELADVDALDLTIGAGLEPGDILLNDAYHTAMYIGNGYVVQASINELGTATGGVSGDQTGREIGIARYSNYPWNCVLRYVGERIRQKSLKAAPMSFSRATAGGKSLEKSLGMAALCTSLLSLTEKASLPCFILVIFSHSAKPTIPMPLEKLSSRKRSLRSAAESFGKQ